jgi:fatty-acyl-CoA synthase
MMTTADLLLERAEDDHPALLFEDESYTWREFVAESAIRAAMIRELDMPQPPHVGVLLENVPEYLFWIGGAALTGTVIVGINPTRRGQELAADIRHTDCAAIVTDSAHRSLLDGLDVGVDKARSLLIDSDAYHDAVAAHRGGWPPISGVEGNATLLLLFTSGSTGAPKAVVCSQARLAAIGVKASEGFGIGRDDVCYESMPLFHGNALMANWAPALARGATVALRRRFSASGFLPDVRRFGATYFNYVGRALAYVLATPRQSDDADNPLRLGFGTEASARDREEFSRRFGCVIVESYGSSEGVIATNRPPGTPPGSIGVPQPGMDVIVADPERGEECPPARFDERGAILNPDEAIGELVRRDAAGTFEGYYRNEAASAERFRDGWYWSGDLAYRDADGWLYFAGRTADRLRVDGENFAAAPVEEILFRYPGVVMVAVYPVPDPRTGDQVMAAIEIDDRSTFDPDAFGEFLAAQADLGTKWAPRFIRIVGNMPLTSTNKVNKVPLRRSAWQTDDPVFWRPARHEPYRAMTAEDVRALHDEFAAHDRAHILTSV